MVKVNKLLINLETLKTRVIKIYFREYGKLVIGVVKGKAVLFCFCFSSKYLSNLKCNN